MMNSTRAALLTMCLLLAALGALAAPRVVRADDLAVAAAGTAVAPAGSNTATRAEGQLQFTYRPRTVGITATWRIGH